MVIIVSVYLSHRGINTKIRRASLDADPRVQSHGHMQWLSSWATMKGVLLFKCSLVIVAIINFFRHVCPRSSLSYIVMIYQVVTKPLLLAAGQPAVYSEQPRGEAGRDGKRSKEMRRKSLEMRASPKVEEKVHACI